MTKARVRTPERLKEFVRSDWDIVIREAALGVEDTKIAQMYFIDSIPQADIGAEMELSRSAVSKRLAKIIGKIEQTVGNLGF